MGRCIGGCKNLQKCFFIRDYFKCGHLMCYNICVKFKHCIACGNNRLKNPMKTDNVEEIVMNHTILKTTYCYCIRI